MLINHAVTQEYYLVNNIMGNSNKSVRCAWSQIQWQLIAFPNLFWGKWKRLDATVDLGLVFYVCVHMCAVVCFVDRPRFWRSLILVLLDRETMQLALFSLAGSRHMLTSVPSQPVKPISIRRYTHTQSHAHTLMHDEIFSWFSQCMRTHSITLTPSII